MKHQDSFEQEFKDRLFEFGEEIMAAETMQKYKKKEGSAKMNFLSLSKKSQSRILDSYFKNETNGERMDEFMKRLRWHRVLQN